MLDVYLYEKQVGRLWEDESRGVLFRHKKKPTRARGSVAVAS